MRRLGLIEAKGSWRLGLWMAFLAWLCFWSVPAQAYIGPGVGLSMIGALWAVVATIVLAIVGILLWPVRAMIKRRKSSAKPEGEGSLSSDEDAAS
jgi:hypothetical protein